ncbi:MAG: MarR family transcriptional regulator [Proteobacteria bacterium]|nr:MAG: MarR family transcriptional regulator [Pseudomonadota bacterium]
MEAGVAAKAREKTRDILDLNAFLPYRLSILSNTVSEAISRIYAERFGLSIPGWRVVAILAQHPGLSAGEAAVRTAMDKVAVSRAVAQLLEAGYLERQFADEDRRRSMLTLSAKGWGVYDQVVPLARRMEAALVESLSPQDRAAFDRLLARLTERALQLK